MDIDVCKKVPLKHTNKRVWMYNVSEMMSSLEIRPSYAARTGCNGGHVNDEINNTKDRV